MKDHFRKLFNYNYWANSKIIECLVNQSTNEKSTISILSHMLAAEQIWLARITKSDNESFDFWPNISIGKSRKLAEDSYSNYLELLEKVQEESFEKIVIYKNSTGAEFKNNLADIITHVINHSTYHRAQINSAIRTEGGEPINVDFITFIREESK